MKTSTNCVPKLKISLLGTPTVQLDGVYLNCLSSKSQALLYYLATTRQRQTRSTLANLLWGDMAEERARANLRKIVQQLRATLGEYLEIERHIISLNQANCWVDVVEFERITTQTVSEVGIDCSQQMIDLYHGDFLTGFQVKRALCFESWQMAEQDRLRSIMLQKLDSVTAYYVQKNALSQAIAVKRRMIEIEPWSENGHYQLMELLANSGNIDAALRQFESCCELLRAELDALPSAATLALAQSFRDGTFQPLPVVRRLLKVPNQRNTNTNFTLVGREKEWQELLEIWQTLAEPHFVCIGGESGIGKTRLAEELLILARGEDQTASYTRCHAIENRLSYSPVVDWLRTPVLNSQLAQLKQTWLAEITRIVPELRDEYPDLPELQPLQDKGERKHFFDALVHAFTVSHQPLLLVLDDLQWCDVGTLEWLHYLIESVQLPLLVVGTTRTDELDRDHPLHHVQQQLRQSGKLTEINLRPLQELAVSELAAQIIRVGQPVEHLKKLFSDTGGNPLFVIESALASLDKTVSTIPIQPSSIERKKLQKEVRIPSRMYSVIRSRLRQLSPNGHYIAQIGAAIGRSFEVSLLARVAEQDEKSIRESLEELWQRRLIRPISGQRFDYHHDHIRDVAYADIGPVRTPLLHQKIAKSLKETRINNRSTVYSEIAFHYEQADLLEEAVENYNSMADAARTLFAHEQAFANRRKAIELLRKLPSDTQSVRTEIDLLLELGWDQKYINGFGNPSNGKTFQKSYQQAIQVGTILQRFHTLDQLAKHYRLRSDIHESQKLALQSYAIAKDDNDITCLCRSHFSLANNYMHLGHLEKAATEFAELMQCLSKVDSGSHLNSYRARYAHFLWLTGFPDQACVQADAAYQAPLRTPRNLPMSLSTYIISFVFCRDLAKTEVLNRKMLEICTLQDDQFFLRCAHMHRGWLMAHNGDLSGGVTLIRENLDAHQKSGSMIFDSFWRSLLIEAYLLLDEPESALREIEHALTFAEESGNCYWNAQLLKLKGDSLAAMHIMVDHVESCYHQAIDTARQQKGKSLELRATVSLARLWQKQGKIVEANQLLSRIYDWFTEGFDTADLQEAKTLLETLNASVSR